MGDLLVSKPIIIDSHKGSYEVNLQNGPISNLFKSPDQEAVYIIDEKIYKLYEAEIKPVIDYGRFILIDANERNKSLEKFPDYISSLMGQQMTRDQTLISIGGGIVQDITCFIASTLMRGVSWKFIPTTLLAQSDSCIGSKSSINSGDIKNILGTFNPPKEILLNVHFLETLAADDILSGVGEMIKVHAIDSPESFDRISSKYEELLREPNLMREFIFQSLLIKKKIIEIDEFDMKERNVMNYGHSFGHAIESATSFSIPHGIAVTIGMDMANFVSMKLQNTTEDNFLRMHDVLMKNSIVARKTFIDSDRLIEALYKDKKNTKTKLRLILPDMKGRIKIGLYEKSPELSDHIREYLNLYHQI